MASPVLFSPEDYIPNEQYFQDLLNKSGKRVSEKILDFKSQYNKLLNKFNTKSINYNQFLERVTKLSDRFNSYTRFISKFTPTSSLRNRFSSVEETNSAIDTSGEEIELFNRGTETVNYGATTSTVGSEAITTTAGGAGTIVGSSSITPVVTVGFGAIAAATGAAILSKVSNSGIQVPGTKYVGPGNPIDNGQPSSFVDQDAKEHDIQYSISSDPQHIQKSDTDTINRFGDHIAEDNTDITALLGHTGLKIKQAIEKHTGQIYPSKYG